MKLSRSLLVALLGATLSTSTFAQTTADVSALLSKAQRGNSIAQYRLGLAYSNGQGVAADPVEAYVWLSLAYEGGFRGKALGNVAGGLDPAQLEAARQRLAERRASLNGQPAPAATPKPAVDADANLPVVRTSPTPAPSAPAAAPAQTTNTKLAEELAAAVTDKQQLSNELSKSWSETEELKKQLTETQAAADFLTAETSKLHAERDALTSKLDGIAKETAALRTERDNARTLGVQAEASLTSANAQKAALESSLRAANESAVTDKKWLSDELTKSFQEVTALKAQLTEAARNVVAAPAPPAYPDLSAKVKELETSLATLTTEAAAAKQGMEQLRTAAPAYPDLREQVAALNQQLTTLTQTKETAEKSRNDLQAQLSARPNAPAYPDHSAKVKELEANLATTAAEATKAKQEASRLADERLDREKRLLTAEQEIEKLRTAAPSYPDLREQVASLNQQLSTLTAKETTAAAAPAYPDLSAKVKELEANLAASTAEATSAKQEASRLAEERIDREKQLLASQRETENLRRIATMPTIPTYPDLSEKVAALNGQLALLQAGANEHNQEVAALTQAKDAAEKSAAELQAQLAARSSAPTRPDLSGKVKELEASLAAVSAEANSAKQEASRLAEERIDREKRLLTAQQQTNELANANAALQQEAQSLRQAAAVPVPLAYPDLRDQVALLNSQLALLKSEAMQANQQITALKLEKSSAEALAAAKPTAPSYPDLSGKVGELEASLAAQTALTEKAQAALVAQQSAPAPGTAPANPDLSAKVQELEAALATRSAEAAAASKTAEELHQAKVDTEQKLAAAEQSRTEIGQQFDEFKRSALTNQREHLNLQSKLQMLESEKAALRQQSTADQTRLADLSAQLAASRRQLAATYPTTPSYPDQRARVEQLEAELNKTNEQANSMVTLLNSSQQEAKTAAEQAEQFRTTIRELEAKVAAKQTAKASPAAAPAYPDQRDRVAQLEAELKKSKDLAAEQTGSLRATISELEGKVATALAAKPAAAAPTYPDLREQVNNLEIQLEAARALPKFMISESQFNAMKQDLADTKTKLSTTLHGYGLIEKERDALAAKSAQAVNAAPEVARLTEANNTLERDLATTRAQLQQALSANNALAQSTPASVSVPAPEPVAARPLAKPTAPVTPVVSAAPAPKPAPVLAIGAPAPAPAPRIHVIVAGDSLTKISQRYYGTPNNWQPIYNANKEKLGPNGALRVGTELRIP